MNVKKVGAILAVPVLIITPLGSLLFYGVLTAEVFFLSTLGTIFLFLGIVVNRK